MSTRPGPAPGSRGARRAGLPLALVLALALLLPGCSLLGGPERYEITAVFPEAVALYEQSQVRLMGVSVGTVTDIAVGDRRLEVTLSIREEVPLPADVSAAVMQLGLIGERNVVLFPPYEPGDARAGPGTTIPLERTRTTIEPDRVLATFRDLFGALDPDGVDRLVTEAAGAVEGHGGQLNDVLRETSQLAGTLAEQDDELLAVAEDLNRVAAALQEGDRLDGLLDRYTRATQVLADQRQEIRRLLGALVELSRAGEGLIRAHQQQLPQDLARLARVAGTVRSNLGSVDRLAAALPTVARAIRDAHDPASRSAVIRVTGGPSATEVLQVLAEQLGIPPPACLPIAGTACPGGSP